MRHPRASRRLPPSPAEIKSRNTKKAQATKDRRRAAARRSVHADAGSQNLPFFAPSLLALLIRGEQSHPDQNADGVGTGWMAGLPRFAVARSLSGRATVRQPPTRQNARGGFS